MNIDVSCEECGGYMEIIKEWTDRSGMNITVSPCDRSIDAQATADRCLDLLRRLVDNGMLTTNERRLCEQGECDDCDLTRDILKELSDEEA